MLANTSVSVLLLTTNLTGTTVVITRTLILSILYLRCVKVKLWMPLLRMDDSTVMKLVRRYNIPENPTWYKLGFSGECLCLAGTPIHRIALLMRHYPEEFQQLLEIDQAINRSRKSGKPSAPFRLVQIGLTLPEFYHRVKTAATLDSYIHYGKSCEGSCML